MFSLIPPGRWPCMTEILLTGQFNLNTKVSITGLSILTPKGLPSSLYMFVDEGVKRTLDN